MPGAAERSTVEREAAIGSVRGRSEEVWLR